MIGMMYIILGGIFAAVFFYLMCLYRIYLSANIRNSGILIAMGMPRKKCKKLLIVKDLGPIMMADVAGSAVGFVFMPLLYCIVFLVETRILLFKLLLEYFVLQSFLSCLSV